MSDKLNLPKMKKSRGSSKKGFSFGGKNNSSSSSLSDLWMLLGIIVGIILFLFVILGGINQVAVLKASYNMTETIGNKVAPIFKGHPELNDNGLYWKVD